MPNVKRSTLVHYGIAVVTVGLALLFTSLFTPLYTRLPFALFYLAVTVSSLYGGRGPGVLATALSAVATSFFVFLPNYSLAVELEGVLLECVFVLVSLVICGLTVKVKRAETSARLCNAQLTATLMRLGDAMIAADVGGCVTLMNPVAQSLTGWKLEDARGKRFEEIVKFIDPQTRLEVANPVINLLGGGDTDGWTADGLLVAKDGSEAQININGTLIRDERSNLTGLVFVFRDVSKEKVAYEKIQFQAHLLDVVNHAMIATDLDGNITYWNQSAEKLYGWTAEEVIKRNVVDVVSIDSLREQATEIMSQLRAGESWSGDFLTHHRDGTTIPVRVRNSPVYDESGKQIGIVGSSEDISARIRIDQEKARLTMAIEEQRLRLDNVVASVPGVVWEAWGEPDASSQRIDFVSDYVESMLGYSIDEWLATPNFWLQIVHPEDKERAGREAAAIFGSGNGISQFRWMARDGRVLWVEAQSVVIHDDDGVPIGMRGVTMDVTERKLVEERKAELLARVQAARSQAELANRTKDEFLATLSHELRTPLSAMLGWTWMLRTKSLDDETFARAVETIDRNVHMLAGLIDELLDVSRIITGKLRLEMHLAELVQVIEAAVDIVRPAAMAKEIQLKLELDPTASRVVCDQARIQQVAWNLLSNAVKFTPKNGSVEVCLRRIDSQVEISVSDTGLGISADFLPYVFDRFRQADSSTTRSYGGLGLGLAIVRHLVELHGGTVSVESDGPDRGSRFTVSLPLVAVSTETDTQGVQ